MKRFDFGIGLGIGFEILQSWSIGMNYDLGFVLVVDGGGNTEHSCSLLAISSDMQNYSYFKPNNYHEEVDFTYLVVLLCNFWQFMQKTNTIPYSR